MREWTDPIQEFPQDNAANYVDGRFDPAAAEARRASYLQQAQLQAKLAAEARTVAQRHRPQRKAAR